MRTASTLVVKAIGPWNCTPRSHRFRASYPAPTFGLVLERLALVPFPDHRWDDVVATMLDGAEVVMVRRPANAPPTTLRRLAARARERQAVLPLGR
jgi:hypothetical protein